MSTRWNSNPHRLFGNEHSRPYVMSPMVLECRICEKVFLSSHSLIEHYESHQNEFARRAQNNLTAALIARQRENRERIITNNPSQPRLSSPSTFQQRYHPYFPNAFRTLQHERPPIAQTRPFPATQTQNLVQPRHPVVNHGTLGVSFPFPNSTSGRTVASGSQFVLHQQLPSAQKASPPRVPFPDIRGQKGHDQLADSRTVWYLKQLEKPIPAMIDLSLSFG